MTPTYLVTGGAGFIGSHLLENLLTVGYHVKVYDNFSTGLATNITDLSQELPGTVEIINGDIRDIITLNKAMQGITGIFHLAALVSVPGSIEQPDLSFDINTRGTQLVLDVARKNGITRIVMASSAAVYGDNQNLPLAEKEQTKPLSPYGLDKSFSEQMGQLYADLYQMNITCLRFFNVFGPRQLPDSPYSGVVSIFAKKVAAKTAADIYGNGEQSRDFVFVKDVANALKLAMHSKLNGYHVYNVGSDTEITIKQLWDAFQHISGFTAVANHWPEREADIKKSVANITSIKTELGYTPSTDFESNLLATYQWLQQTMVNR